jgi:mono/diheme cytochrome c family protein
VKHVLSAALLVALLPATAPVASAQAPVERGQKVFAEQKCSICHSIAAQGNKKGPLDGAASELSADEIRQWIVNAPEMAAKAKAERKPPMKAYGTLAKEDIDGLVAYLQSLKKK